jgi:Activator of Hsp90 ATPase homolog 1-like protein
VIRKSAYLSCPPARAFKLFTERASDWWPEGVRHTGDPQSEIRMLADGRFWERATDGREVELGRVLVWEPAQCLILDFYPGTDDEHPTEVVVRFSAEDGGTRIVVEHSPKPESAELWATGAPKFERSWSLVLEALRGASGVGDR